MTNFFGRSFNGVINFFLLLILCYSCAAKKLVVNNADTLLEHQITKRLPLYSKQKKALAEDVTQFLKAQKPRAREVLPVIDKININNPDEIDDHYLVLAKNYDQIALDFSRILSKHMAKLDSKQQKDFFKTLAQENRELKKKDPEERTEKIQERFENFFGSINEKQKQKLTDLHDHFEARNKERILRRIELHAEFERIFENDLSPESRQDLFVKSYAEYQKKSIDHKKNIELIKAILPTVSEKQKEFFKSRTREVKEILKYFLEASY